MKITYSQISKSFLFYSKFQFDKDTAPVLRQMFYAHSGGLIAVINLYPRHD